LIAVAMTEPPGLELKRRTHWTRILHVMPEVAVISFRPNPCFAQPGPHPRLTVCSKRLEDPCRSPMLTLMRTRTTSLTQRAAIVTGASSGIGEATARRLAENGFDVALIARRKDRLEALAMEIGEAGGRAIPIAADLADEGATARAAQEALDGLGRIDLLVNNAGYSPGRAVEQVTRQELRHIFDVNLFSALQLIGAVTPRMRNQGSGLIINIGSVAGLIPAPLAIPYAATKIGLHAATDALRLELAPFGIKLSLVIPGFVDTAVFENAREEGQYLRDDLTNPYRKTMFDLDELAKKNLRNALSPDDVASVVLRAANARQPKERYYAPFSVKIQHALLGLLPARLRDAVLLRVYKLAKP
jgi:short-subunit dehydrogenase